MAQFRDELQTASRKLSVEKLSLSASAEFVPAIGFREATLAAAASMLSVARAHPKISGPVLRRFHPPLGLAVASFATQMSIFAADHPVFDAL